MSDIKEKIKLVMSEQLHVELEEIKDDSKLIDDLGAYELGMATLLMALEEAFKIRILDEEAEKFDTVGDVVRYFEVNSNKKSSATSLGFE